MPLKIMNWNIQNFGLTRAGREDTIKQVSRAIHDENANIVCIQELQVSSWSDAKFIVEKINHYLQSRNAPAYNYILCPWNRFEMYLYLYRGGVTLRALTLGANGDVAVDNGSISNVTWTEYQGNTTTGNGASGLNHYFPLFHYDKIGNAARAPGFGLFRYRDGNNNDHDICLLNWHNDASGKGFIKGSIKQLARTPIIAQGTFNITTNTGNRNVDNIVIAGDFNNELNSNPFTHYTRHIAELTHLGAFDKSNDGIYKDSSALRDATYDNLLTCLNVNGLTAVSPGIVDLPKRLWDERNNKTKDALATSNLLAQADQQIDYRKRLISRITSNKKTKRQVSKKSREKFRGLLDQVNLGRVKKNNLRTRINGLDIPPPQQKLLVTAALMFIEVELTDVTRWAHRSQNMNAMNYNDALFLTLEWMSDHLPLVITLNP